MKRLITTRASRTLSLLFLGGIACGDDISATSADSSSGGTEDPDETSVTDTPDESSSSTTDDPSTSTTMDPDTSGSTTTEPGTESSSSTDPDPTTESSSTDDPSTSSSESTAESSSSSTEPMMEESSTGEMMMVCPAGDFGAQLPASIMGSTVGQDSEFSSPCGGGGAPDMAFTFTAPADGPYTFDTFGSALDTIISVRAGVCDGDVLECNDDGIGDQSLVSLDLVAGQTVTVVVDGFAVQGDDFVVTVSTGQVDCPRGDLGSAVPQTISDNTALAIDEFAPSCGSGAAGDFGYLFTAPADGDYTFDTLGSSYNTVLAVYDAACMGNELACNNDAPGGAQNSGVIVPLVQDQQVTVVVDGSGGAEGLFDLNVGQLAGMCPDGDLGGAVPTSTSGSTAASDNTVGGSCGGAFGPDETFTYTAPSDGLYTFSTAGSDFDTVVYVRDAACNGAELGCNNDSGGATSALAVPLSAGQDVVVVVDSIGVGGNYDLEIDTIACPGPALAGPLPIQQLGSTAGLVNSLIPPCSAGSTAPETTYTFTAPADGTYTFDTNGSAFDTVLYLYEGAACGGTSLGCDDDGGDGTQSLIERVLDAGETVTIVVDGYNASSGNFTLNVSVEAPPMCTVDEDLGMAAPPVVDGGVTMGASEIAVPCGLEGGAPEYVYNWTVPADGNYQIDTNGSAFDTVLHIYDGSSCSEPFLECDDDDGDGTQSLITRAFTAGEVITIVVDGYNANAGAFTLNITSV
jgi:hypothetical protein